MPVRFYMRGFVLNNSVNKASVLAGKYGSRHLN